jgi:DHA2 family multidrug resistance protein
LLAVYVQVRYLIAAGMAATALSMFYMTSLSGDAGFSFYAWARVFQTVGLPFVFISITSASYHGLPPEKTSEASSLINVARNVGGSIGISVATAMLARGTQIHQNYLVDHLVPSSPQYQAAIRHATAVLTGQGMAPGSVPVAAIGLINQTVVQQSTLLAYIDVFRGIGIVALLMVPLALVLLRAQSRRGPRTAL